MFCPDQPTVYWYVFGVFGVLGLFSLVFASLSGIWRSFLAVFDFSAVVEPPFSQTDLP